MLQEVLECEAYLVDTASDGLIALDKITHQQAMPGFILLDLHMPRLDGLQLIEALRQHEEAWLDSIIVISGDMNALQQASRLVFVAAWQSHLTWRRYWNSSSTAGNLAEDDRA
jgi:CheY-like chemotaxis protein